MIEKKFTEEIKGKLVEFTVRIKDDYQAFIDRFELPETQEQYDEESQSYTETLDSRVHPTGPKDLGEIQVELKKVADLFNNDSFAEDIFKAMGRKANGTLHKGGVHYPYIYPWGVEWEDSYCWAHPAIKAKALSDTEIEVTCDYYKNKW